MRMIAVVTAAALVVGGAASAGAALVGAAWLEDRLGAPDLAVLDIRNRIDGGSSAAYRAGHIPGAVHSSYTEDGWRVAVDGVAGMLPPVSDLEALIGELGIDERDHVVIVHGGVGSSDFGSAARIYWTFQQLGHAAVSILDGGFRAWTADAARPVARGAPSIEPVDYVATAAASAPTTVGEVLAALDGGATLLDARPAEQYRGASKHAAARVGGHIPGALNFSQANWFDAERGEMRDVATVAATLPAAVREGEGPLVSYCNTGHWAATNWFVLSELLGRDDVRLYDGSMTEWTADPARPVAAVEAAGG